MSRIAIVDYGMGNFHSVARALQAAAPDHAIRIANTAADIRSADRVVFPGQGAMPDCMRILSASGLREAVEQAAREKPLLGVCVGEQMLFDSSEEGHTDGLGLFRGTVRHFSGPAFAARSTRGPFGSPDTRDSARDASVVGGRDAGTQTRTCDGQPDAGVVSAPRLKIPHMGWNPVAQTRPHALWAGIAQDTPFYFVHSYYAVPADIGLTAGTARYGDAFCCAIAEDNIFAVQFHPEKSAAPGLRLYHNFTRWQP